MKFQIVVLMVSCAWLALAEPPVDNRYLPPQQGFGGNGGYASPSGTYGPPGTGVNAARRQTDAVFRNRPSSTYGAPSFGSRSNLRRPSSAPQLSSQYSAPSAQVSSQYLPPSEPSAQYGPPQRSNMNRFGGSSRFGSQQGGSPATEYGAPSQQYGAPSQQYGAPGFGGADQYSQGGNSFAAPSSSYGAPEQNRRYLPPGAGGRNGDEGENGEPASYSFEYMVQDEESGNDFGHRESREGNRAEGRYYVLLPDGRKQTVEYEADEEGYKPRISYEDTTAGAGGYGRNAQPLGGYQGGNQGGSGPY